MSEVTRLNGHRKNLFTHHGKIDGSFVLEDTMTIHDKPGRHRARDNLVSLQLRLQSPQFLRPCCNPMLVHNLQANLPSARKIPSGHSRAKRARVKFVEKLERSELRDNWFRRRQTGRGPVETSGPPQSSVGSGRWWVRQRWALEGKPHTSHDWGSREVARANGRVREVVIILVLVWNVDHGTRGNTPSLLDTGLNNGSIVVDAVFTDSARREGHCRVVRICGVRSREGGTEKLEMEGSGGTCLRCRERIRGGG